MLRAILYTGRLRSSCILPHAGIVFLQVSSIKSPWKTLSLHRLHHIRIPEDNLDNLVRSFPTWRPLAELIAFCPKRQYCLPNQLTNLKRFCSYFLVVSSSHPKLILLNFLQSLQPLVAYFINIVHHRIIVINSGNIILLSQSISVQIHLNGQNSLLTIHKLKRNNFGSTMSRYTMSSQCFG